MKALQYIYTSWKNGESTNKGYMIYSKSEGITEAECEAIRNAMRYSPPHDLPFAPTNEQITEDFPYGFASFNLPGGRRCVALTTYLGKDYSGRFGNYIIYALVFEKDGLECRPVDLFGEPFMKTAMTQEELNASSPVPPLPLLEIADDEVSEYVNSETLEEFLPGNEDNLARLITLILEARTNGDTLYINDTRENLVLWVSALQYMLPESFSCYITFSTYVADPLHLRQDKYLKEGIDFALTGAWPDSSNFNYAVERGGGRRLVFDVVSGTYSDMPISGFAKAMADALSIDAPLIDRFGVFLESTSYRGIDNDLMSAYAVYRLLNEHELDRRTPDDLSHAITFADRYLDESRCGDFARELLDVADKNVWDLDVNELSSIIDFIASHARFMSDILYRLVFGSIYQIISENGEACDDLLSMIDGMKHNHPDLYRGFSVYMDSPEAGDDVDVYLRGNTDPWVNSFYLQLVLSSYEHDESCDLRTTRGAMLKLVVDNLGSEPDPSEIIVSAMTRTIGNESLFATLFSLLRSLLRNPSICDGFCTAYARWAGRTSQQDAAWVENELMAGPVGMMFAVQLCAARMHSMRDPKTVFWDFVTSIQHRSGVEQVSIAPLFKECIDGLDDDGIVKLLTNVDSTIAPALLTHPELASAMAIAADSCDVKTLVKADPGMLYRVLDRYASAGGSGDLVPRLWAVGLGESIRGFVDVWLSGRSQKRAGSPVPQRIADHVGELCLRDFNENDYKTYVKEYAPVLVALVPDSIRFSALARIFGGGVRFQIFVGELIPAVRKLSKRSETGGVRLLADICVYYVTGLSKGDTEALRVPLLRYVRKLDDSEYENLEKLLEQMIPDQVDAFFNQVDEKESIKDKLGDIRGLFRKFPV